MSVEPFLRELIVKISDLAERRELSASYARLVGVVLDELRDLKVAPLHLPLPRDPRLKAVTDRLIAPGSCRNVPTCSPIPVGRGVWLQNNPKNLPALAVVQNP